MPYHLQLSAALARAGCPLAFIMIAACACDPSDFDRLRSIDAATLGTSSAAATTIHVCPVPSAALCKDWEDGSVSAGFHWVDTLQQDGNAPVLVEGGVVPGGHCMQSNLQRDPASERAMSRLNWTLPAPVAGLKIGFDFSPDSALEASDLSLRWLAVLQETDDGLYPGVALSLTPEGAFVDASRVKAGKVEVAVHRKLPELRFGAWNHVALDIQIAKRVVSLTVDEHAPLLVAEVELPYATPSSHKAYVAIGLSSQPSSGMTASADALYDNLTVEVEP